MAVSSEPSESAPDPAAPEGLPLVDAVRRALDESGHGWLRRVVVSIDGGVVVLRGVLPNFYLKQMAQMTVLAVPGVAGMRNELQVGGGDR